MARKESLSDFPLWVCVCVHCIPWCLKQMLTELTRCYLGAPRGQTLKCLPPHCAGWSLQKNFVTCCTRVCHIFRKLSLHLFKKHKEGYVFVVCVRMSVCICHTLYEYKAIGSVLNVYFKVSKRNTLSVNPSLSSFIQFALSDRQKKWKIEWGLHVRKVMG